MILAPLLTSLRADTSVAALCEAAAAGEKELAASMPLGFVAPALALLAGEGGEAQADAAPHAPLTLAVTRSGRQAERLAASLGAFLDEGAIEVFPAWETLPHERLSPRSDTVAQRLRVLRRLAHPDEFTPLRILVAPVRAVLQPIVAGLGDLEPVRLRRGQEADLADLAERLSAAAYTRVDMIEGRGQFAVRGGILDVFPPQEKHPLRIELFGDEVDEIRRFSVADQRSIGDADELYAPGCREILLSEDVRARARELIPALPGAVDMLDQIAGGIAVEGMESLAPVLVDEMVPFISTLPASSRICVVEPEKVAQRAELLLETTDEFLAAAWSAAAGGGKAPISVDAASFTELEATRTAALSSGHAWWALAGFSTGSDVTTLAVAAREPQRYLGNILEAIEDLSTKAHDGWDITVVMGGHGTATRIASQFAEADTPALACDTLPATREAGVVYVTAASLATGFICEAAKLIVATADDLTGRAGASTRDMRATPARRKRNAVDPLTLKPGDHIVHERHGVGRFVRMETRSIGAGRAAATREYIVIDYAPSRRGGPNDQLWLPTDQLDLITRYQGGDAPRLNKMGGADWQKTKAKAKAATRHIAAELLRLYAERLARPGHAFAPDTPWQRELEDAFEYVETPDQLHTIDEVKADMERPVPMDRLISGDVGYGKTEIAVRAAFKAVQDSKQVAVLVPTTLLVVQHFDTFRERYAGFPVRLAALSRFQSDAEAAEIVRALAAGEIDVVIGTHRLLTGEVRFKDLGLVIIDEEQRFGVEHKESLTQMYPGVDVLSMSATPIPRTLEMAMTGVREMSTLATPPEERRPVLTYVGRYEDRQIIAAIRRELLREGQVFFVHNRVSDLAKVAAHVAELVPEARVGMAHGQMGERQLEDVIQDFWERRIDVLVCTTIVETGLDIANANTLIVDGAHRFGLSQLHQLRGRVGRGRERAYAYFLYNPDKVLTETALERLRTIATNTELGSGIQVALKDLEIRGAGNMLGGEQSGNIAGVGFDLYVRMISEAVEKMRGKRQNDEDIEVRIELPVEAYLPEAYIASERLRLEMYQKIAASRTEADREEIRVELRDRYGPIGPETERLFALAHLREIAEQAGITDISMVGKALRFSPVALPDSRQARLKRLYPSARLKPAVRALLVPLPSAQKVGAAQILENEELLTWVENVVTSVFLASIGSDG